MKKLLLISISLAILILTGCNNVDAILSNYSNIFTGKQEKSEQIEVVKTRNAINYCDVLSDSEHHQKNIYEVLINVNDQFFVEGEYMDISQLKEGTKAFIDNNGSDPSSSDSPEEAIFLIKSEGSPDQDDEIIELINSAYNNSDRTIERKICFTKDRSFLRPPPPPPPPPPPEIIEIVEDEVEIEAEIQIENTELYEVIDIIDEDEVFMVVENMPKFPGGDLGLMRYIQKNVQYPPIAKEYHITGKVYINFIVDKSGFVTNVKVVRGVDKNLDAEAVRVIKSLPKYKPGTQRGKPERVMFTVPINFTLK